jgi:hypothetical protein
MITYKNISPSAKTFYGVKFAPGELKSVPGYINNPGMVRVFGIKPIPTSKTPVSEPAKRGRKPKSTEPEKVEVAEPEIKLEDTTKEETSDGNNC